MIGEEKKCTIPFFFVDQCATNIHTNISGLSLLFANTQSQLHRSSRAHRVYSIVKYILTDFLTAICICLTIPLEYHKNVKPIFDVNKWWGDHNLLEWWKKNCLRPHNEYTARVCRTYFHSIRERSKYKSFENCQLVSSSVRLVLILEIDLHNFGTAKNLFKSWNPYQLQDVLSLCVSLSLYQLEPNGIFPTMWNF